MDSRMTYAARLVDAGTRVSTHAASAFQSWISDFPRKPCPQEPAIFYMPNEP